MTFQEFLEKYNGKFVEVAGSPGAENQCVDLANAYIRDVLGLPIIEWTNAIDFPSKAGDAYEYIKNTPTGIPKEGDLVIWGGNKYGHIAIFIEGNADTFRSFDQNFPTGSNVHVQNHNYTTPPVLGWLRAKHTQVGDQVCMPKGKAEDFNRVKDGWNQVRALLNVEDSVDVVLAEVKKIKELAGKTIDKENALKEANELIKTLEEKLKTIQEAHAQNTQEVQKVEEVKEHVTEQAKAIEEVVDGIQEVKEIMNRPKNAKLIKRLKEFLDAITKFLGWR